MSTVTAALGAVALALVVWPDRRAERLGRVGGAGASRPGPGVQVADLPMPALAACVAAAGAAVVSTVLVALLAAILAAVGARAWRERRRADRTAVQLDALTEGLGALAADLRSGRSLAAATDAAVAACADEECGRSLARVVRAPAARTPPGDPSGSTTLGEALRRIEAAVLLSARTGCSLAAVLGAVEDDLRARRRHRAQLRAATAGPGASALVLAGLPVLGLAMGSGVGADPWRVLTTTGTGQALLVAGVALELAGLAWSRRLVRRALR